MTPIPPDTRADMFKRGYVHERRTWRKVPSPYGHEEHELIFCIEEYEKDTGQ